MTYKTDTNQFGDASETLVQLEFQLKGWTISKSGTRDAKYDLVADINGEFVRIQVKKMKNHTLPRVVDRNNQRTTKNGKVRNSTDYAGDGIELLIGVDIESREIFPFELSVYKDKPKEFKVTLPKHEKDLWQIPTNKNVRKNNE